MRKQFFLACLLPVAGCASTAAPPDRSCLEVVDSVKSLPGVKVSHQLRSTQVFACYYGFFKTKGEAYCVTDPYFPDYLGDRDTFVFKTRASEILIASISFGSEIAHEGIMDGIRAGYYHDTEACLKSIHDVPEYYDTFIKYAKELIDLGY